MSDPTPPAGSVPDPDEADTVAHNPSGGAADEAEVATGRASAAPPPPLPPPPPPSAAATPPAPMPSRMAAMGRSRWLPQFAIAILILILGIGIGAAGTLAVGAIVRHVHRGPAAVGHGFDRKGVPGRRVFPPGQRPVRPGVPVQPGRPANPGLPASPAPSPTA
jgi:hypothetical protein